MSGEAILSLLHLLDHTLSVPSSDHCSSTYYRTSLRGCCYCWRLDFGYVHRASLAVMQLVIWKVIIHCFAFLKAWLQL